MGLGLREAVALQRRTATFLMIFSVVVVAFIVTTISVQWQDAACQERAREATFAILVKPFVDNATLTNTIADVLRARGIRTHFHDSEAKAPTLVELLDTADAAVSHKGYQLTRKTQGSHVQWSLCYYSETLCGIQTPTSMEILPIVDYEQVSYGSLAAMVNGTRGFLHESMLKTSNKNRFPTFAQFKATFVGFRSVTSSGTLDVQQGFIQQPIAAWSLWTARGLVTVLVDQWRPHSGPAAAPKQAVEEETIPNFLFWRVLVTSLDVQTDVILHDIHQALLTTFANGDHLCTFNTCVSTYDRVILFS